jgi:mRNA deadenylase 3'-5' endonuclease subunit Ccr4
MTSLKIMSFNILGDAPIWKTKYEHIKKEDFIYWDYRKELIIKIINKQNPDICVLCEVQHDTILFFSKFCTANNYGYIYTSALPNRNEESLKKYKDYNHTNNPGNLIIFKLDKVRLINNTAPDYVNYFNRKANKYNWSPEKLDEYIKPAVSNIVQFEINSDNKRFYFTGLHHPHIQKEEIPNEYIEFLLKKINKINDINNLPVIVCGDFNSIPSSTLYKIMEANKYESCYKLINKKENKYTIASHDFKNCVDYIFIKNCKVTSVEPINEEYLKNNVMPTKDFPSDHMFLVATIKI